MSLANPSVYGGILEVRKLCLSKMAADVLTADHQLLQLAASKDTDLCLMFPDGDIFEQVS